MRCHADLMQLCGTTVIGQEIPASALQGDERGWWDGFSLNFPHGCELPRSVAFPTLLSGRSGRESKHKYCLVGSRGGGGGKVKIENITGETGGK